MTLTSAAYSFGDTVESSVGLHEVHGMLKCAQFSGSFPMVYAFARTPRLSA
ncbi:MAG: hypothetical protein ACREDE_10395 [Thermoplasmata archaeon]